MKCPYCDLPIEIDGVLTNFIKNTHSHFSFQFVQFPDREDPLSKWGREVPNAH